VNSLELFQLKYKDTILQKGFRLIEETSTEAVYQNDDNTLTIIDTDPDSDLLFIGLSGRVNSISRVHHQDAHGTFERILHQFHC
jgi:hypothetical protein